MKKKLNEILSVSRNERIGLLCIALIIGTILLGKWLSTENNKVPLSPNSNQAISELSSAIDSAKVDTIKRKKRSKIKEKKDEETLTVSHMKEVKHF